MPVTVSEFMNGMPKAFQPEKAQGVKATILFKFTGAEAGDWTLKIADGKCDVNQGAPSDKPTMTVSADSGDLVKIFTGEMDGMQAFMQGKLKLAGDLNLAMKLLQMFKLD